MDALKYLMGEMENPLKNNHMFDTNVDEIEGIYTPKEMSDSLGLLMIGFKFNEKELISKCIEGECDDFKAEDMLDCTVMYTKQTYLLAIKKYLLFLALLPSQETKENKMTIAQLREKYNLKWKGE